MEKQVIVLVTKGKHETVDYAQVMIFNTACLAEIYCKQTNTGKEKYWVKAEIVGEGKEIELCQPEEEE